MDAVEEVKQRLSIEDVISEYVPLKRAGRNWKGLSPFTSEKTASFVVSPEKQIWHDFSSGKGGNMFSFVMEVEGLDFKGALELLARKAGIDIEQYRSAPRSGGPNKERLYELLEAAARFYQVQFSQNKVALDYVLKQRGFSKDTALEWRLGYSPNTGSALVNFAKSKGFTEAEVKQAGLSSQSYRGSTQDMFRGRLMVPLQDPQGRVIGFTARQLDEDPGAPKYINTPQTVLYDKSRHIYGLHLAKEAIRKGKFAVLVEGNLDVIASHQAGVRQVVATAGTALTESQLKALSRFTGDIRLSFDADHAGVAATERAIPIASRVKVSLSIIDIPSGKDPDELIKQDPKLWQKAIEDHEYALDWLMKRYSNLLDITSAQGKREFSDVLLPVVRGLSDEVERDHYLNQIAARIDVGREALEQKLQKTSGPAVPTRRRVKIEPKQIDKVAVENQKLQDNFLSLMLMRKTLRAEFLSLITTEMLYTEAGKELLKLLQTHPDFDGKDTKSVQNLGDYVKIQALLYEELYQGLELNELHYEAARLQARLVENFVKTEKEKLAQAMEVADDGTIRQLLERAKQFDILLSKVKGAANA
ncbi:MAG TPA: DNA primase [Candidatus Saccharimonadales bacterium]|jgi:DNA primase|nr:DNA primase [Candidatus Saccharimonadales bacterium]